MNEIIFQNMKLKDCVLIDCQIEEGALLQNCKTIIDGEVVSPDCDCLKISPEEISEKEKLIEYDLLEEFEEGVENAD